MPDVPRVVTFHLWRVPRRAVPLAVARMAIDRPLMARSGAAFWKLLGTGRAPSFSSRDADPQRWAVLASWPHAEAAQAFETSPTVRGWDRLAAERLTVRMRPLASRGEWARRLPFGNPVPRPVDGPVASITRARIRTPKARTFRRAVPQVAADLASTRGLRLAVGIGEAPVRLQGTFSMWSSGAALTEFAHCRPAHADVVRRTAAERWYAEELFARFEVLDVAGTADGRRP